MIKLFIFSIILITLSQYLRQSTKQKAPVNITQEKLAWSDEFNYSGLPDPTKWNYDSGGNGWGNKEKQFYTVKRLENARVENGMLIIEARKELMNGCDYTSTRLKTTGKGDWKFGHVEVRAKIPRGIGT